jgi:hypothetical protein
LKGPATTRIDGAGHLLVTEYALNQVLRLDASGACLARIGQDAGLDRPHMAVAAADGSILVADTWNHRLLRFDAQGKLQAVLATPPLNCPVAIDLDARGRMLVTCWGSEQILLLDANGDPLPPVALPPLSKPYDARFTDQGIVVADTHHGRLLVVDNAVQQHQASSP